MGRPPADGISSPPREAAVGKGWARGDGEKVVSWPPCFPGGGGRAGAKIKEKIQSRQLIQVKEFAKTGGETSKPITQKQLAYF